MKVLQVLTKIFVNFLFLGYVVLFPFMFDFIFSLKYFKTYVSFAFD